MKSKLRFNVISLILASSLLFSACQTWIPKAQGLVTQQWGERSFQRQDQMEVHWRQQGFSFLMYQEQKGQTLEMLALSLTGQQLFKLDFDGQKVKVEQRIEQLRFLPFDYVVRDILYATYPNFISLHVGKTTVLQKEGIIYIQQQPVLKIDHQEGVIELENLQVPYEMVISTVSNTLEADSGGNDD